MRKIEVIALSLFSIILIFNYIKPSTPMPSYLYGKGASNNDGVKPKSDLTTKAGFDVNTLVDQAKELEDKKSEIRNIIEASIDLMDQLEGEFREKRMLDQKRQPNLSKQQVEDSVQNFLISEFNFLINDLLEINKKLANKVLIAAKKPSSRIDFK